MSGLGASVALALLLAWAIFALAGLLLSPPVAVAPFGVMLPALAARHMAVSLGADIPGFSTVEIGVFLVVYVAFLSAAFGVIPLDLYRYGYAPWPAGAMVLAVCAYAWLTGNWFLAGVAVLGQLFWVFGWGSSNWFDHVLHVFLVPVAAVVLLLRIF